jgi:hypothetical protein
MTRRNISVALSGSGFDPDLAFESSLFMAVSQKSLLLATGCQLNRIVADFGAIDLHIFLDANRNRTGSFRWQQASQSKT